MLKVTPLGGVGEIGLNSLIIETDDIAVVVDAGLMFPDEQMPGIDIVIPDFSYVGEIKDKLKALILTHGHEDHIGAVPFFIKNFNVPIYSTAFTSALLNNKFNEHGITDAKQYIIAPGNVLELSSLKIEFIQVVHSISDCVALAITSDDGIIVHSGDFKIDTFSGSSAMTDLASFARLGSKGVTLFLSDSTNAEKEGYSLSESIIAKKIEEFFLPMKGRLFIAVFASNIPRIGNIFKLAKKYSFKVYLDGKSMVTNVTIASELGFLDIPHDILLTERQLQSHPEERTVILTTGTQGEPMSALTRMSHNSHRLFKIKEGDTVILSSRYIPGNERAIHGLINRLLKLGARVFYEDISELHTSGHAKREELRTLLQLVRPKYFMPIHGEFRHLIKHRELALDLGIPLERVLLLQDGDSVSFKRGTLMGVSKVKHGRVLVDGKGVGDVEEMVLRDRRRLSTEGIIIVLLVVEADSRKVVYGPDIISRGVVLESSAIDIMEQAKGAITDAANELLADEFDMDFLAEELTRRLKRLFILHLERRPLIMPIIIPV